MKNFYQLLAGGLLATLLNAAPLPSVAQSSGEGYISAFTDREIQILEQEYLIDHPGEPIYRDEKSGRLIRTYNTWRYHGVRKRGGQGEKRWLLLDLGEDSFGNQYRMDTRNLTVDRYFSFEGRTSYPLARVVVQIIYNNPAAHNGVLIRHLSMEAVCFHLKPSVATLKYLDYDANGNLIARGHMPDNSLRETRSELELKQVEQVCRTAQRFPKHVKLLQRGLDRNTLHQPSIYD